VDNFAELIGLQRIFFIQLGGCSLGIVGAGGERQRNAFCQERSVDT
jgi:hypothetical protein